MSVRHLAGAAGPPAGGYDADIVILALDRPDETIAAVRSALAQTGLARHVTVLDQGSGPETLARLVALTRERRDATLLAAPGNLGVAGGRDLASALGHGRVVAALDNDAVFDDPRTLARAVAALDSDPGLAAIGFRILVDATGEDDFSSWGYPASLLPRAGGSFEAATFVGAGHAIRRAAWAQAGGYDRRLFFCWEEYDFCLRAIAQSWRIRYRGDLAVRHKVSPERRVEWSGRRWFFYVRNRLYVGRKHGEGGAALGLRASGYVVRGLRNGFLLTTLRAIGAAARLSSGVVPAPLPQGARAYLRRTDRAHRGSWLCRLRGEVLAPLPGSR